MNATLIATTGGLVTALCWGTSDWLASKSAKKLSPFQINFGLQVSGLVAAFLLYLVSDFQMPNGRQLLI